ncbi:receptor-type tyrosine-protein phosphatase H isoform X7 [Anabas testudineus]|uniref:receptor-type tyrosine-protein phosphatase H isoform X7 n=1 Tax=Anabas testudineus TaxID=64144 RepID=UPI000E463912|nr:receptor-type tyrosine-protein phosphatase H isoform X7 [Anabas testudineus]
MRPLSFKITSDHFLLWVLLSLLWGVTGSVTASPTTATTQTAQSTTLSTIKPSPENVKKVEVQGRNETSITLTWSPVNNISTYILQYNKNGSSKKENISASQAEVKHEVSSLNAGTKYHFTLVTVFEGVNSTGYTFTAVTVPPDAKNFRSVGQNETSITLQWEKVDAFINYALEFSDKVINITALAENETVTYTVSDLNSGNKYKFTLFTVFENVRSTGVNLSAVTVPSNAEEFKSVGQSETSITLQWKKVDTILNYALHYNDSKINVTTSAENETVTYTVSDLNSGNKYKFTLFTVFENVRSTGVNLSAVTAPENVKKVEVQGRNETSITLTWSPVNNSSTYILQYDKNGSSKKENISASQAEVKHEVSSLNAGTKYHFTLVTVFEGVNSTGYTFTAVTVPPDVKNFRSVGQNETSITLQWEKVDAFINYALEFSDKVINITALAENETVTYRVSDLNSGNKYKFTLFTVFENVRSTGVNLSAVTVPSNAEEFKSVGQSETSITLQWKKVDAILNYALHYNDSKINVTTSAENETITYRVSDLNSGNKYKFTLFTVFENVRSTGVNLSAVTAPENVKKVEVQGRNETSITLTWSPVNNISTYILQYNKNGSSKKENISASQAEVKHEVSSLNAGTKYHFTLVTVFEGVNSTGYTFTAVTVPPDVKNFRSVGQNETSITLQWTKVDVFINYALEFSDKVINITALAENETVTYTVSDLNSGNKYKFTLFTVFENVRSTGVNLSAVTAPENVKKVEVQGRNETSITLTWSPVNNISTYILQYNKNGSSKKENISASQAEVKHEVSSLNAGTKYHFTLVTVFEGVNSTGYTFTAVTAPENVKKVEVQGRNETSITLTWSPVNNISTYILQYNKNGSSKKENISASQAEVKHEVSSLNAGTKYHFTLVTVFEGVNSTGYTFTAVTVPPKVPFVNVSERSVTSITLKWINVDRNWSYLLQINGSDVADIKNVSSDVVSHSVTSLNPGTMYKYSVTTVFEELNSTAYENVTVTAIDCASVAWHVGNSSIKGIVEGLFSNATASNGSQTHVSFGGNNVSFTGLYPGATYEVSLMYETYQQCRHNLTILPPGLTAHCEYWAAGYSIRIVWNKPVGMWTDVEVNVTGKPKKIPNTVQYIVIPGFLPARTYEVSLASFSGTVRSSEPFVFKCSTDPRGVIAGSVLAVLLFCVLVFLAIFILFIRPDLISRKRTFISGCELVTKKCSAISVDMFAAHFHQLSMDDNRGFSVEYESLIPVGTEQTQKVAVLPENKPKNRFNNVLPYDWCRVKLTTSDSSESSDYINANYMPGYNSNREYIATQGPLPSTVNDFWRMIWEQTVGGVVMVTNCTEGGRTKCERYWPANSTPCLYGNLLVTMTSEQQDPNWTLRDFNVKHRNTSEQRTVKHFHFTSWPDHGVPQCTEVLMQFRGLVRRHIERERTGAPTVVHCSAGVGRTGTIIALDVLLQQLEKKGEVDINGFVHKMRLNRPHMVQTESQYVFLHQCIMDILQPDEKTDEHIYENTDMIYVNATALQEFRYNSNP